MGNLSPEEKKEQGKVLTDAKTTLTEAYEAKERDLGAAEINQKLKEDLVDISLDGAAFEKGNYSILAQTRREAEEICKSM
jgi:phenylalanyl-tRNA synthetase alpha subunit